MRLADNTIYMEDGIGMVAIVQHAGDDKMVANAARVSLGMENELPLDMKDEKLIRYLIRKEHGSPFEHNMITFKVVCPIFVDRQWVRHRAGVSKNETSGRYVKQKQRNFKPPKFRKQAPSNRQASVEDDGYLNQQLASEIWDHAWHQAYASYELLLTNGVAREQARGVLPQSLYTESYYTFNLRSLFHFVGLRDHEGAQYEMQQYARMLLKLVEPLFPVSVREWRDYRNELENLKSKQDDS